MHVSALIRLWCCWLWFATVQWDSHEPPVKVLLLCRAQAIHQLQGHSTCAINTHYTLESALWFDVSIADDSIAFEWYHILDFHPHAHILCETILELGSAIFHCQSSSFRWLFRHWIKSYPITSHRILWWICYSSFIQCVVFKLVLLKPMNFVCISAADGIFKKQSSMSG